MTICSSSFIQTHLFFVLHPTHGVSLGELVVLLGLTLDVHCQKSFHNARGFVPFIGLNNQEMYRSCSMSLGTVNRGIFENNVFLRTL